jgi:nickel/cobalt transporter (NicO) family protein
MEILCGRCIRQKSPVRRAAEVQCLGDMPWKPGDCDQARRALYDGVQTKSQCREAQCRAGGGRLAGLRGGMLDQLIAWQRWIYAALSADLNSFAATRDWTALALVLPTGILFGAIHALTPGHGKSILASYIVGSRLSALRATAVASALALTHVGTAVLIALLALPLVTRTLGGVGRAPALEAVSRGLLVTIGVWLVFRAWRGRRHVHGEGVTVGIVAGLVPCPLTLFVMFYALSRGVPAAGFAFAGAMMLGILVTLSLVALLTILMRETLTVFITRHGVSVELVTRLLDGAAGLLLVVIAAHQLAGLRSSVVGLVRAMGIA